MHLEQLADRQLVLEAGGLQDDADAVAQRALAAAGVVAEHRTLPDVGMRWPSRISAIVVLPAPLGPSRQKTSPCGDVEADAADGLHVAVALADVVDFDCGHADKVRRGPPRKWRPS